jgi:HK97 family phage major capsid protein
MSTTTFDDLARTARNAVNAKTLEINKYAMELEELRSQDAPDPARVAEIRSRKTTAEYDLPNLQRELQHIEDEQASDDRLARSAEATFPAAERQAPGVTHARSTVYSVRDGDQYFKDLLKWSTRGASPEVSDRLMRHTREMADLASSEQRAGSTTSFGGVVPPQYLADQFAQMARAGRPVANTTYGLDLPAEGMSLIVPRGTTGSTTAIQSTQNSSVSNTDMVETDLNVPVFTIAGQQDVSRQAIERGVNVQQIVLGDLSADYAVKLDQQVLTGTGSSGQGLGILNTSGIGQATAFSAAVTLATFYSKLAGQINAVQTSRFLAPNIVYMHPRRWNWLISQLDTTNRPLVTPELNGPNNAYAVSTVPIDTGSFQAVGTILGLPVVTDASIPTSVGTGPEDQVIVARREDLWLWENNNGAPSELVFQQTLGNQLTVKLIAYGYAAFTAGRYPSAVGVLGGNAGTAGFGLIAPTF